jgi:hypothetical protein
MFQSESAFEFIYAQQGLTRAHQQEMKVCLCCYLPQHFQDP